MLNGSLNVILMFVSGRTLAICRRDVFPSTRSLADPSNKSSSGSIETILLGDLVNNADCWSIFKARSFELAPQSVYQPNPNLNENHRMLNRLGQLNGDMPRYFDWNAKAITNRGSTK